MDMETAMDMEDMGEATEVITDEDIINLHWLPRVWCRRNERSR